jgi:nucleotide-binding universal stress UspA family protein
MRSRASAGEYERVTDVLLGERDQALAAAAERAVKTAPGVLIDTDPLRGPAARYLASLLDDWRAKYPDVPVSQEVVHGHPGRALVGLSARADLVVVGRHAKHPGLPGAGPVRHALLNHAHGPVVIVPSA